MGARVREFDWSATRLGPSALWPRSLRTAVSICLNSRFPMFVWWGPDLVNIYNDAYIPVLGKRHPQALGLPARGTWAEIWPVVGPQADAVVRRGESTWNERVLLVMERNGYTEDTWFTWSYSPIPDDAGGVGGVFCACKEETGHVVAERERDRIAGELAEARARMESTLSAAEVGTWTWDVGTNRVVADRNLARMFGVSSADAAGGPIEAYLAATHPDDRAYVAARIDAAVAGGQTYVAEYRLVAPDGHVRWVIARGRVERDADGAAVRLPGVVVDVTEQKRAEGERRDMAERFAEQSRRFDTTLSAITDFAYIFDRDGRFLYVNKALLDLWGLPLDQAVGRNFYDLKYPDELAAKLQRQIQQVIDTRQGLKDETPYTSPTGAGGFYEYIFSPVFAADGTVEVVAGSTRDITERKRLALALDHERSKLAAVVQQAPAFICTLRGPEHVFELANERYLELIGRRDVIGKAVRDALPEVEGQGFFELLDRVFNTGESHVGEQVPLSLTRDDGTPDRRFINFVYQPVREADGRVSGIFVHGIDVTGMVRAQENERAARNEAEAANRAKDRFLAVLSHELRTPLSPVVMTIPAMEIDPDLPFKFRDDLAMVRRNIELEVKLIDDLLDLSRVTTGKLRLQMQPVRVHELLRHVIYSSSAETSGKRLQIRHDLRAANDRLTADPARLQQVFWNLVRNAIKFTPEGGEITVRTSNPGGNGRLRVEVEDNGMGIPPETLPRVFDAFEQGEVRMTRQFGGLGLGLAIAKAVIEMHGGTIAAASEGRGRGATFTVQLPTAAAKAAAAEAPAAGGPAAARNGSARARLLLVEDHPDTARTLARLLKGYGYDVQTADSAASALQLASAEPFDILLSDIGLPDATGYELMREIRDRFGIKGIALSGYGMEEDMRLSREAGFVDHVIKPVNLAHLEAVIRRVATGEV
jgi:PAS domain S-box-containing protein